MARTYPLSPASPVCGRSLVLAKRPGFKVGPAIASALVLVCAAGAASAQPLLFTFTLSSPSNNSLVIPSTEIAWTISAVGDGTSLGLAGFSLDLIQSTNNPATIPIPPATGVPTALAGFSRPAGISNPSPDGVSPGYCGTPVGPSNNKNLREIGGIQNTYGASGGIIGQDLAVEQGIAATATPQILASGSLSAPQTPGEYRFMLANAAANALVTVQTAPTPSVAMPAGLEVFGEIVFTVKCIGDFNTDGSVDGSDIEPFFLAFADGDPSADVNLSGGVDGGDVETFFIAWEAGC